MSGNYGGACLLALGICWGWTQGRPSCLRPTLGWTAQAIHDVRDALALKLLPQEAQYLGAVIAALLRRSVEHQSQPVAYKILHFPPAQGRSGFGLPVKLVVDVQRGLHEGPDSQKTRIASRGSWGFPHLSVSQVIPI